MQTDYPRLPEEVERHATEIVDCCYVVHREMGPGLLESIYEECLGNELSLRGIRYRRQMPIPIQYKGAKLSAPLRIDLLVEDTIILELKCVRTFERVHEAQLLSYLKLASKPLGFLLNFHVMNIKDGIRRYVMSRSLQMRSVRHFK
jgi:GxxExxY protein